MWIYRKRYGCLVLTMAVFLAGPSKTHAQAYGPIRDKKALNNKIPKGEACLIKKGQIEGQGAKNAPYIIRLSLSKKNPYCGFFHYDYKASGREEYFKVIGLKANTVYQMRMKRIQGDSKMLFKPQGKLPGIFTKNLSLRIGLSFSTSILSNAKGNFSYSLSAKDSSIFSFTIGLVNAKKNRSIQV